MEQRNYCKSKNYEMFKELLGKTRFLKSKHTRQKYCKLDSNLSLYFFLNIARHKSLIIGPEHCILIITSKKKIQILENVKNLTE